LPRFVYSYSVRKTAVSDSRPFYSACQKQNFIDNLSPTKSIRVLLRLISFQNVGFLVYLGYHYILSKLLKYWQTNVQLLISGYRNHVIGCLSLFNFILYSVFVVISCSWLRNVEKVSCETLYCLYFNVACSLLNSSGALTAFSYHFD